MRGCLPVAFAAALLLGISRAGAREAGFAEVARKVLLWSGGAIGKTDMVTIRRLVRASHCGGKWSA